MTKERICYYCKHAEVGFICPSRKCRKTGRKVEDFDFCNEWEDYEED